VKMMKRVILYTEREELAKMPAPEPSFGEHSKGNAISAAAAVLAKHLPAKLIIAETSSGQTARNIAALRPSVPIIMVTDHPKVYNQLALVWGGKAYLAHNMATATDDVIRQLKAAGNVQPGDALVVASGAQPGLVGGTNKVEIRIVD
jgi:pyruvate kinase